MVQTHSAGPEQVSRTLQYDLLGRLVLNIEPNTSVVGHINVCPPHTANPPCREVPHVWAWRYAYDDAGHLVGTSDARGCGKNLSYDGLGRLIAEDYSPCRSYQPDYSPANLDDGTGTESYFRYDAPEPGQTMDFGKNSAFLRGQLVATSDRGAHTRFAWDARGRDVGLARQLAKPVTADPTLANRYAPWWFRKTRIYDEANRVSSETTGADVPELMRRVRISPPIYESNVQFNYTIRGLLHDVSGDYGTILENRRYDADGALLTQTYGDVAATNINIAYNNLRNVQEFKVSRAAPSLWSQPSHGYAPPPIVAGGDRVTLQLLLEDLSYSSYDSIEIPNGSMIFATEANGPLAHSQCRGC